MPGPEFRQARQDQRLPDEGRRRHPQRAPVLALPQLCNALGNPAKPFVQAARQPFALRRQPDTAAKAAHQRYPQFRLKTPHRLRHGRMRDIQRPPCLGKTATAGRGVKGAKRRQGWKLSPAQT
jgi:hypothetical protein